MPDIADLPAEEAREKASRARSSESLDRMEEEERQGRARSSVFEAILDRRKKLGDSKSEAEAPAGEQEYERPPFAGLVPRNDDTEDFLAAFEEDPKGSAVVPADEVLTAGDRILHGTHVRRGRDGRLYQVAQVRTDFE